MARSSRSSGFWAEGHGRHLEALKAQEHAEREELERQLLSAPSPARRAELTAMVRELRQKYRRLRQAADQSLYVAGGD